MACGQGRINYTHDAGAPLSPAWRLHSNKRSISGRSGNEREREDADAAHAKRWSRTLYGHLEMPCVQVGLAPLPSQPKQIDDWPSGLSQVAGTRASEGYSVMSSSATCVLPNDVALESRERWCRRFNNLHTRMASVAWTVHALRMMWSGRVWSIPRDEVLNEVVPAYATRLWETRAHKPEPREGQRTGCRAGAGKELEALERSLKRLRLTRRGVLAEKRRKGSYYWRV